MEVKCNIKMTDRTILEKSLGLFNLEKVDRDIFSWSGKMLGIKEFLVDK